MSTKSLVSPQAFQKHVGHHFEQLALFALPMPMKESSRTSSKQAALSYDRSSEQSNQKQLSSEGIYPVFNVYGW